MSVTEHEGGAGTRATLEPDNVDHTVTEQIDWSSFVDFEYDPAGLTADHEGTKELCSHESETHAQQFNTVEDMSGDEDVITDIGLDFPCIEQWWDELPVDIQFGDRASPGCSPRSNSNSSFMADEQSPSVQGEGTDRKRRQRMLPKVRRQLTDCFERHIGDPYIPKEEVCLLATETGLSIRQVQVFFANARARKLPHPSRLREGVEIPVLPNQQGPMERFLSSSPEDEGISEDAVRIAANNIKRPIKPARSRKGRATSVRSSSQSSASNSSSASMDSLDSRGSRKGRKRQREPSHNVSKSIFRKPSSPSRKHQCTFCSLDFEQKYDWKRHEESVHFPQKEWICMPNGPVEDSQCVFCGLETADDEHLRSHKSITCSEAIREMRTFQRKDKLVQHIKQVHGCQPPKMMKEWCRPIDRKVLLLCGFCSLALPDWKTRTDHICSHFNNGLAMTLWLPELIGGIWPDDGLTREFVRDRFSATEHPEGQITCNACPARFLNLRNLTLHRRQAHNIYLPTDAKVVMSKPTSGHHSQRLINLAQQTSRIQITRMDRLPGGATLQNTPSSGALVERPDHPTVFSSVGSSKPLPTGMRAPINRQLDEPERRGFSSMPHPAWKSVLNSRTIAVPRSPMRSSLSQQPIVPDPSTMASCASAGSSLNQLPTAPTHPSATDTLRTKRPSDVENMSLSNSELAAHMAADFEPSRRPGGPPVEAIRSMLTNNRRDAEYVDAPMQGMLHSLEQFGDGDAPWPKPPDSSFRYG